MRNARRYGTPILLFASGVFLLTGADSCATADNPKADTSQNDPAAAGSNSSPAAAPPAAKKPAAPAPAANGKPNDKGWVLQSFRYACQYDNLMGSARITNTTDSAKTATFSIPLFQNGDEVATLQGSAQGTDPGKTVSVDLVSMDPCVTGAVTKDFQVDVSY